MEMCVKVTRGKNVYFCTDPVQLQSFIDAGWKAETTPAAAPAAEESKKSK